MCARQATRPHTPRCETGVNRKLQRPVECSLCRACRDGPSGGSVLLKRTQAPVEATVRLPMRLFSAESEVTSPWTRARPLMRTRYRQFEDHAPSLQQQDQKRMSETTLRDYAIQVSVPGSSAWAQALCDSSEQAGPGMSSLSAPPPIATAGAGIGQIDA